ncbi:hypothetical protein KUH03_41240 [Sphingobacterium sp. E70]|uniref:hypothetical protein n=1 Tax=Sphingobacterium sp. E70 TaxID=2853439 RepID=UPI00211D11B2|nr:hypothetical protein [Sphingobacterium sp. E70]ULT25185.1 hypothetical protein KUH03_41240 [Sphingobacterium sp. E70]
MRVQLLLLMALLCIPFLARPEDGSQLWLRFSKLGKAIHGVDILGIKSADPTVALAKQELLDYWKGAAITLQIDVKQKQLKDGYQINQNEKKSRLSPVVQSAYYTLLIICCACRKQAGSYPLPKSLRYHPMIFVY